MSERPAGSRRAAHPRAPTRSERSVARRAAEARATIPDLELGTEVEVERTLQDGVPLTAILVRACALALRDHPRANAAYRDGQFELYERINVGLVVSDEHDLVLATIFDADDKAVPELATEIEELRQRAGALTQPERSGATFALMHQDSVAWQTPMIWSGHAASVVAGAVREVPLVRERRVVPGRALTLILACDHRILYGAAAAAFLTQIKELVEGMNL